MGGAQNMRANTLHMMMVLQHTIAKTTFRIKGVIQKLVYSKIKCYIWHMKYIETNKLISTVKVLLCPHKYETFKVGEFPLVAAYCKKCGKVKFGNCVYHTGTTYQKSYKGADAINFVKGFSDSLASRCESIKRIQQQTGQSLWDYKEQAYRDAHETVDRYNEIVGVLENKLYR